MHTTLPSLALFVEGTFLPSREGATRRFVGIARSLTALGHKVIIIHCYRGWSDLELISSEPFTTYAVTPDIYYGDISRLANILASERIDIIQFFEIETVCGIGLPLARLLPSTRLAFECHDVHSEFLKSLGALESKINNVRCLEHHTLPLCDLVTCFTSEDRMSLLDLGAFPERTFTVAFGIELCVSKVHRRSSNGRNVVFLGNLYHRPNQTAVSIIVRMLAPSLSQRMPPCHFTIVGDYPPAFAQEFCERNVRYVGAIDCLDNLLSTMTIAVAPVTEGSGIKVKMLDYFAAGLPVVGTSLAFRGYPQSAGLITNDLAAMPDAIVALLDDEERLNLMSIQCRRIAETNDWRRIAPALSNLYAQAASRPRYVTERLFSADPPNLKSGTPYVLDDNIGQARFANAIYPRLPEESVQRVGGGMPK